LLTARVADLPTELRPDDHYVGDVATRLANRAPGTGQLLVRGLGPADLGIAATLVNELDRSDTPASVDQHLDYEYGPQRTLAARDADTIWLVSERGWISNRLRRLPGARVMFAATGLPAAQEQELERAQVQLYAQLRHAKHLRLANLLDNTLIALVVADVRGVDDALARRVASLNDRSKQHAICRCVVVAFDHPDVRTRRAIAKLSASY